MLHDPPVRTHPCFGVGRERDGFGSARDADDVVQRERVAPVSSTATPGTLRVWSAHSGACVRVDLRCYVNRELLLLPSGEPTDEVGRAREAESSRRVAAARLVDSPCAPRRGSDAGRVRRCDRCETPDRRRDRLATRAPSGGYAPRRGSRRRASARRSNGCRRAEHLVAAPRGRRAARVDGAGYAPRRGGRRASFWSARQPPSWRQSSHAPRRTTSCAATA